MSANILQALHEDQLKAQTWHAFQSNRCRRVVLLFMTAKQQKWRLPVNDFLTAVVTSQLSIQKHVIFRELVSVVR